MLRCLDFPLPPPCFLVMEKGGVSIPPAHCYFSLVCPPHSRAVFLNSQNSPSRVTVKGRKDIERRGRREGGRKEERGRKVGGREGKVEGRERGREGGRKGREKKRKRRERKE